MGISRDSRHKRRATGGRMPIHRKKKRYEMGRQASMTKLGAKRVHLVRTRGGNTKFRALRLDHGNFAWASQSIARKAKIIKVVYNASNNELVRTKTLVKNSIIEIDATPFRQFYAKRYGVTIGEKKEEEVQKVHESGHTKAKKALRLKESKLDKNVEQKMQTGRLFACISSRPGQVGRADGYILEGAEFEFYNKKIQQKKK